MILNAFPWLLRSQKFYQYHSGVHAGVDAEFEETEGLASG